MSEKHVNDIVAAVEANEAYASTIRQVPDDQKESVKATLAGFAKLVAPMVEALEAVEGSEEVAQALRERLAEKLRGG